MATSDLSNKLSALHAALSSTSNVAQRGDKARELVIDVGDICLNKELTEIELGRYFI